MSAFQWMRAGFLCPKCDNFACLHTRQGQNKLHRRIWFFFGIFCKSFAGPLPSVLQAYTQPYSFGGRIKLIICKIRHELSATIHEISTIWQKKKKNVKWRTFYLDKKLFNIVQFLWQLVLYFVKYHKISINLIYPWNS